MSIQHLHEPSKSQLHLMSCMDAMHTYADDEFDLAIVDPPYGINVNHNMGRRAGDRPSAYEKVDWDNQPPPKAYFDELFRISKNQVIWGANHFISRMPYDSSCWLMWDKKFSDELSFAQFELAWTSFNSTCKKFDKFPNSGKHTRIHPTQKPVTLYEWILQEFATPKCHILDTHTGSGSSRIACHNLNHPFTGYEIDEKMFNASVNRFNNHIRQLRLF